MTRRTAACLAAGLLSSFAWVVPVGVGPAFGAEPPEPETDPLTVTIDRVGPAAIPQRGPITVGGEVTNVSDTTWSVLRVYLLTSTTPMTTASELAAATELDPRTSVGDRLTGESQFVEIPDLEPGESARYVIRMPRSDLNLTGDPGVYWLGTQVLGQDETGRDVAADGRARTFVPLMRPSDPPSTSLALMLQFRGRAAYDREGRVESAEAWRESFARKGRMGRLLEFARSAGAYPVTWVLDAALMDLAGALANDDPGLGLGTADRDGPSQTPTQTPADEGPPQVTQEALAVQAWLTRFVEAARSRRLLTLPYGDIDVAGAFETGHGELLTGALERAEATLLASNLEGSPVVAPPDGVLPWEALQGIGPQVPVVLSESAVAADEPRVDVPNGPRLTLTSEAADDGLPGTDGTQRPLAMRQRILAEAAVHALSPDRDQPLVVSLPARWDPGAGAGRAGFFQGLIQPWLVPTSAASLVGASTTTETIEPDSEELLYPEDAQELPFESFAATKDLAETGHRLDVLLPRDNTIGARLEAMAYTGSSFHQRDRPQRASDNTRGLTATLQGLLDEVTVSGPKFVTMSSEEGPFQVTVTNGLDQAITVGVQARAIGTDKVAIPAAPPITIPPGQRRSVRMQASSSSIGVWPIVLEPVNAEGDSLGGTTGLRIRTSHVGRVVWGVLGGGTLLLLVLIVVRVRRKVKARQATHGPMLKRAES